MTLFITTHPTRNQASKLPDTFTETLAPLNKLKRGDDFDAWHYCVKSSLEQFDLEDLIDFTIPRPNESDNEYAIWARLSKRVKMWMTLQLSTSLIGEISRSNEPSKYADEFIRLVKKLVLGNGHNLQVQMTEGLQHATAVANMDSLYIIAGVGLAAGTSAAVAIEAMLARFASGKIALCTVHRVLPNRSQAFSFNTPPETCQRRKNPMQYLDCEHCNETIDMAEDAFYRRIPSSCLNICANP
jgi:hypothetical protein